MSAQSIRRALLAWYDTHRRALPWRAGPAEKADPYRVWLSEIMLQQTTTAHAAPYFQAFVERWPTVTALAGAPEEAVMAAWAGLGYYARARNVIACARQVAAQGGRFPQGEAALRRLPGLGAYSAAAIAAIAQGATAVAIDGNIRRVVARLFAIEGGDEGSVRARAGELLSRARPGDWTQALMDLGATICRPADPPCPACPLGSWCAARAEGRPDRYPGKPARPAKARRSGAAYLLAHGGRIALVRRPPGGLLGGMLGMPTTDWREERWTWREAKARAPAGRGWRRAGEVRHLFTHLDLELKVLAGDAEREEAGYVWLAREEARAALPSVFRKALALAA